MCLLSADGSARLTNECPRLENRYTLIHSPWPRASHLSSPNTNQPCIIHNHLSLTHTQTPVKPWVLNLSLARRMNATFRSSGCDSTIPYSASILHIQYMGECFLLFGMKQRITPSKWHRIRKKGRKRPNVHSDGGSVALFLEIVREHRDLTWHISHMFYIHTLWGLCLAHSYTNPAWMSTMFHPQIHFF